MGLFQKEDQALGLGGLWTEVGQLKSSTATDIDRLSVQLEESVGELQKLVESLEVRNGEITQRIIPLERRVQEVENRPDTHKLRSDFSGQIEELKISMNEVIDKKVGSINDHFTEVTDQLQDQIQDLIGRMAMLEESQATLKTEGTIHSIPSEPPEENAVSPQSHGEMVAEPFRKALTPKQQRVLELLQEGKNQSAISQELGMPPGNISRSVASLRKWGYLS